jgi:hypothetical protein
MISSLGARMKKHGHLTCTKVEDLACQLDLAWLRRVLMVRILGASGCVAWMHDGIARFSVRFVLETDGLRLSYIQHGIAVTERLPVVTTATAFGGRRHWFSCPACGRRCRILYGADRFRCRRCLGARYASQYQDEAMTIAGRRWRLRDFLKERGAVSLGQGLDAGMPPKPPGMRQKTYRRLCALDRELERRWTDLIEAWLDKTDPQKKAEKRAQRGLERVMARRRRRPANA